MKNTKLAKYTVFIRQCNSNNNKEGKTLKTPKQYNDNLKNKIITEEMFSDCLYSVNKRAKTTEIRRMNINIDIDFITKQWIRNLIK